MNLKVLALGLLLVSSAGARDSFSWRSGEDRVSADIQDGKLHIVLEQIAAATRWQIFIEPGIHHTVSTKFKDLRPGEALPLLLGELNFALVPQTNAAPRLFIFRTTRQNATELVRAKTEGGKIIPNELVVRLKPGGNIDDLARLLGGKVMGRIPGLNAYRLQFESAEAANAARERLAANPEVAAVDNNYSIDRPMVPRDNLAATPQPPHLQLRPPPDTGRIVVGLIDTAVQPLGNDLDKFFLKPLSLTGEFQPPGDTPSHGTSMAETMLRSLEMATKGSTSVQILPVDVYGPNENTSTFDVANGIALAVNSGANVINLSLGSEGDSPFLRDLLQQVVQRKIAVFAAAGNQPVTTPFYPAAYSDVGVVAVTAIDRNGQIAPYANRGSFINVAAPGTSIFSFNGQTWYAIGTSSATAVVSGLAAGYMDSTRSGTDQMQAYIRDTLGVKAGR